MLGKLITVGVTNIFNWRYPEYYLNLSRLSKEDTYISIFGPTQTDCLYTMLNDSRIKIIYQAAKAVNRREGHGPFPRNTLVVWELSDEQSSSN